MGIFERNQSALWTELDGQFMLMNIEDGAYYEVVGVGSAIWKLLESPCSEAEIVDRVVEQYAVDRAVGARDVRAFLDKLVTVGMLFERADQAVEASRAG